MATENSLIAVDSLADKDKVRVVVANGEDGLSRNITVENLKETLLLNSLTTRVETLEASDVISNTKHDQFDTSITDLRLDLGQPGSSPTGVFSDLTNIRTDIVALQDQNIPLIKENLQKITNRVTLLDGLNGAVPVLQDQQKDANDALISLDTRKLDKTTFEAVIANAGKGLDNSAEVMSARDGKETLGARLNDIDITLDSKSDKIYVDSQDMLKADKTYVDSQDLLKADKTYVDSQDLLKADKTYVDTKLSEKVDNFKLTNEVINGNFTTSANWTKGNSITVYNITDNQMSFRGVGVHKTISNAILNSKSLNGVDRFYLTLIITASVENSDIWMGVGYQTLSNKVGLTEKRVSVISKNTATITNQYAISGATGVDYVIKKALCINLTSIFGTNNEPTKEEMDELMKIIPNQWWDGELTLTQKQVLTWQLNLIRKNTNAIISLGGTI